MDDTSDEKKEENETETLDQEEEKHVEDVGVCEDIDQGEHAEVTTDDVKADDGDDDESSSETGPFKEDGEVDDGLKTEVEHDTGKESEEIEIKSEEEAGEVANPGDKAVEKGAVRFEDGVGDDAGGTKIENDANEKTAVVETGANDDEENDVDNERVDGIDNHTDNHMNDTEHDGDNDVDDSVSIKDANNGGTDNGRDGKIPVEDNVGDEPVLRPITKSASSKKSTGSKPSKTVRLRTSKTVSSIDVDMSRIMSADGEWEDDGDGDDAVTRVACGKSVDFDLPVDHEAEQELQRVMERPGSGRLSAMDNEEMIGVGRAATCNTPVTNDDRESYIYARSIRTPSREGIYEHALNLINNRCRGQTYSSRSQPHVRRRRQSDMPPRSAASLPATLISGVPVFNLPNVVENINKAPFQDQPNSFFYVAQSKPLPMKPMKVWKGYRGNVYFEPMVCRSVNLSSPAEDFTDRQPFRFPSIAKSGHEGENGGEGDNSYHIAPKSATTTRSKATSGHRTAASGVKSAMSMRSQSNSRQLAILDKTAVLDRLDYNTAEDIQWISGIESTGTLQVGPAAGSRLTGRGYKVYRNGSVHPKLRIRRGLVSHNAAGNAKNSPKLGVSGGRINEDPPSTRRANHATNNHSRRGSDEDHGRTANHQSYNYVDQMSALEQIMKRNNGHGRSKLVHILPSAYNGEHDASAMRAKRK